MKTNKLIFPLMLALAATLAVTGCKKGPTKITQLPGEVAAPTGDTGMGNTLPPGPSIDNTGGGVTTSQTGLPLPTDINPDNMIQDRATLAGQTVHFAYDSAAVKAAEESKVIIVSEALKADATAALLIEGNCDERGTEEYNRSLGERRALALREDLVKDGVDSSRMVTRSYGKDKPVDPGHDESAWAQNRRGDFVLLHAKPPGQ